jgi:hypothetical protein
MLVNNAGALMVGPSLLVLAKMWAYPRWWSVIQSAGADAAREDVD